MLPKAVQSQWLEYVYYGLSLLFQTWIIKYTILYFLLRYSAISIHSLILPTPNIMDNTSFSSLQRTNSTSIAHPMPTINSTIMTVTSDNPLQAIILGIFGLFVAIIGVAVALLQLRHLQRRKKLLKVFELA